jgi:electron transfer flavoprotein beta subunit
MVKEMVEVDTSWWTVKANIDNGYRLLQVKLPAVFTVTREVNTPRTLSFSGIIKARKKQIEQWGLKDLGVSVETVGLKGSPTIVSGLNTTENKREVEFITGSRTEKAELLVQKLIGTGLL